MDLIKLNCPPATYCMYFKWSGEKISVLEFQGIITRDLTLDDAFCMYPLLRMRDNSWWSPLMICITLEIKSSRFIMSVWCFSFIWLSKLTYLSYKIICRHVASRRAIPPKLKVQLIYTHDTATTYKIRYITEQQLLAASSINKWSHLMTYCKTATLVASLTKDHSQLWNS